MKQHGATPRQAAELAVQTRSAISADDRVYIAAEAARFPDTEQPDVFRDKILKQCIDAAAQ
jgi:hypothetical protein